MRSRSHALRATLVPLLLMGLTFRLPADEASPDPSEALQRAMSAAETSLRDGELELADSHYRSALLEGFLLLGAVQAAEGRLDEARGSLQRASAAAIETRRAQEALAQIELRRGQPATAVDILSRVVAAAPDDFEARRLLVQARVANGQPEQAVQELQEARGRAPDDPELAYLLATGYLRLGQLESAGELFARVLEQRPLAATHVLIGRAYRDAGQFEPARRELRAALRQDPRVRRAHYYLGMVAVLEQGVAKLEEAIGEFRKELALAPRDPVTNLRLGMALVEAQRPQEALAPLELVRDRAPSSEGWLYLGRCLAGLDRPAEARPALEQALASAQSQGVDGSHLGSIHYQLGLTLRKLGAREPAERHFAEAARLSAERTENARERLTRYMSGANEGGPVGGGQDLPLAEGTSAERRELERRIREGLARADFNLGVIHAQARRFSRAARFLEEAAELDPQFPRVQYSLGVARFNAGEFDQAVAPLSQAREQSPQDPGLGRMLALCFFNLEKYADAVELLRYDVERENDPSLQYAYGLALVRSGRAAEAERVFSQLVGRHADSAALQVVLGQAHAQQGNYPAAIEALQAALRIEPGVPEASGSLGLIYFKQGHFAEAEAALRAELRVRPADTRTQQLLATTLDLQGRSEEALPILRAALHAKPEFADARYLLGKILLGQGQAEEAAEQLAAAGRLAPDDANIHYQLAQAYQKLGRRADAATEFERYRAIKDEQRQVTP